MKCTPLDYTLAIVADENAPVHRRDEMARASAAFCHPKLSATATIAAPDSGNCITNIQVLAIPRGVFLSEEQIADPSRLLEHAQPFEPVKPTPGFDELPSTPPALEPSMPLPVEAVEVLDNPKLTRLDRWRVKRDDEPSGAA